MKKVFITGTIVLSLLLMFFISSLLGLYNFKTKPTTLTISYLISIFSIIEYLFVIIFYLINKKRAKEKITVKKIISMFLLFISLLFILFFILGTNIDWLNYYSTGNSAPFYLTIIKNSFIFLVPSIIFIVVGIILIKR